MVSIAQFGELRRGLPLIAAVLLVAAIVVPLWRITLSAPQYMEPLRIELYAYPRLGGDVAEIQGLNQYVGFYYPDPVYMEPNYAVHDNAIAAPEWLLGPVVFVTLALTGLFVAVAPTVRKLKLGLTAQLLGTLAVFAAMFGFIQYRLYQAGHSLDPGAPLSGVDAFTPPLIGRYQVANIEGFAWLGPGGYMTALAVVLLVVAFLAHDSTLRFSDVPSLVSARWRTVSATVKQRLQTKPVADHSAVDTHAGRMPVTNDTDDTPNDTQRPSNPVDDTALDHSPGASHGG